MDLIFEALKVMLFGMLGIFFVMGVIIIFTHILNSIKKKKTPDDSDD